MDKQNPGQEPAAADTTSVLERRFPHIVKGLVQAWIEPEAADRFLATILVDDRNGRAGLPEEAFEELMFISDLNWKRRHFNDNGVQVSPLRFGFGNGL
ncbi:hypothetical protein EZJ19_10780 [Parasulfuritortus cantonensis]|uniref:Uncharacterized protein n=1 Tax=Parasulfuritortus cantonensis TaxID=2528202 RepID=A0A4R1B8S4_9PROT|nr:hypothetical protein [Parasulfuritortus cantonensis]TCJ12723.1 hypothetical protein EZJ19_10780 [Parasulfuritortus cantonensis]